jgi:hypothetical protein
MERIDYLDMQNALLAQNAAMKQLLEATEALRVGGFASRFIAVVPSLVTEEHLSEATAVLAAADPVEGEEPLAGPWPAELWPAELELEVRHAVKLLAHFVATGVITEEAAHAANDAAVGTYL